MTDKNHPYETLLSKYRQKLYGERERLSPDEERDLRRMKTEVQGREALSRTYLDIIAVEDMNNIRKDAENRRGLISEASSLEVRLNGRMSPAAREAVSRRLDEIYGALDPEYR